MFSRTEQTDVERAIVEKLSTFKSRLVNRAQQPIDTMYHRFLLDVLHDIVTEAARVPRFIFPLDRFFAERDFYKILFQQYHLVYLRDNQELNPETIETLLKRNETATHLRNEFGIILYRNQLHCVRLETLEPLAPVVTEHSDSFAAIKQLIREDVYVRRDQHSTATATQHERIMNAFEPGLRTFTPREHELLIVFSLIGKLTACLEAQRESYRELKWTALQINLVIIPTFIVGVIVQNAIHVSLLSLAGQTVSTAKLVALAYILGTILAVVVAIFLGAAFVFYLKERACTEQLVKFDQHVQQKKTYSEHLFQNNIEQITDIPGLHIDNQNQQISAHYPSMVSFFTNHAVGFNAISDSFNLAPKV